MWIFREYARLHFKVNLYYKCFGIIFLRKFGVYKLRDNV